MNQHEFLPPEQRTPDTNYRELLQTILKKGKKMMPIHGTAAYRLVGHKMEFDMKNGFPLITERDMTKNFKGAIGEHIGFLNGAQTIDDLEKYGCPRLYWEETVTAKKCADFGLEPGQLGPGSYGAAWTAFPTPYGKPFNQIDNIVNQIKKMPYLRTHIIDPWIPYYTCAANDEFPRKVVTAPCHGKIHVHVFPEDGTFILEHNQRSGDCPVGVPGNIAQYGTFGLMLERTLGYEYRFDKYLYYISDAHIYENQLPFVEEMLTGEAKTLSTITFTDDAPTNRLQDFRKNHFLLSDYDYHTRSFTKIPAIA